MTFALVPQTQPRSFTRLFTIFALSLLLLGQATPSQAENLDWVAVNSGLSNTNIIALAADAQGSLYAAAQYGGMFKSSSANPVWTAINNGLSNQNVNAVLANGSDTVFAGTNGGLFITTNGGSSWSAVAGDLSTAAVSALTRDDSGNLYAGTSLNFKNGAIYKSTDGGATWSSIQSNTGMWVTALQVDKAGNLFVGTEINIYKCGVDGSNLVEASNGLVTDPYLDAGTQPTQVILSLNADTSGNVYAGTQGGLFKSSDAGANWTLVGQNRERVHSIVFDGDGNIYVGTGFDGQSPSQVYRSDSSAENWQQVRSTLGWATMALTVDANGTVNAGTTGGGVFQTNVAAFSISGTTSGSSSTSINVTADISVAYNDLGKSGYLFVHAKHPILGEFLLGPNGWVSTNVAGSTLENLVSHSAVTLGTHSIPVLTVTPFDLVALKGLVISAGYGTSAADVLNKQTYDVIYTVQ